LTDAQCRAYIRPEEARLLDERSVPVNGSRQITLFWPISDRSVMSDVRAYLAAHGDGKEPKTVKFWTDAPTGSGKEFPGRWRVVSVDYSENDEGEGLALVLREGWALTLAEDEARTGPVSADPLTGLLRATRYWPNIATPSIEPLVKGRKSTAADPVTNPTLERVAMGAGRTFSVSNIQGQRSEDGSGVIQETLTEVTTFASAATSEEIANALRARPMRVRHEASVLALFSLSEGAGNEMVVEIPALHPGTTTWVKCMQTVLDANLTTAFGTLPSAGSGWVYAQRVWSRPEDNSASLLLLFKRRTWSGAKTWAADAVQVGVRNQSGHARAFSSELAGLSMAQALVQYKALGQSLTAAAWVTGTAYVIGDYVTSGSATYVCVARHTAAAWADDLAANRWLKGTMLVDDRRLTDRGEGQFAVGATLVPSYGGDADADAVILRVKPAMGQTATVLRVWPFRTLLAKQSLCGEYPAATGCAVKPYSYPWPTYNGATSLWETNAVTLSHADLHVDDHGDGRWTVRQMLVYDSDSTIYYTNSGYEYKKYTRSTDDAVKTVTYEWFAVLKSTRDAAWKYIAGKGNVVGGTKTVQQLGPFQFEARCLCLVSTGNWT